MTLALAANARAASGSGLWPSTPAQDAGQTHRVTPLPLTAQRWHVPGGGPGERWDLLARARKMRAGS